MAQPRAGHVQETFFVFKTVYHIICGLLCSLVFYLHMLLGITSFIVERWTWVVVLRV